MQHKHISIIAVLSFALAGQTTNVYAQAAGAGADFNKADRAATAKEAERQRLEKVDPPIRPDPVGNALIGGAVTGSMKGAAAGAVSAIRGAAIGTAVQEAKEKSK
jgi:hypothetical protein